MRCRGCIAGSPEPVLDLGDHYLPDFVPPGGPRGEPHPLRLMLCERCGLAQLAATTPRNLLYHDRYGFRSGINEAVREDLRSVTEYALDWLLAVRDPRTELRQLRWLDIACNDGTLLSFVPSQVTRIGIDPLGHLAPLAVRHADRVVTGYFSAEHFRPGSMDVITSVSMFYDLEFPGQFAREVETVLAPDGVWVIQQNYAADMIANNAVDNICHEHITYFSVRPLKLLLERAGLRLADVAYSPVNGGCIRTLVTRPGSPLEPQPSVEVALLYEKTRRLDSQYTWRKWGAAVRAELEKTRVAVEAMTAAGKRVYLYGASTRGGTILQMTGMGPRLLPYAVERNPGKVGTVMTSANIPVISEEEMRADPPDALLVSPWFFRKVFEQREAAFLAGGGQMIFPLPQFEITGGGR